MSLILHTPITKPKPHQYTFTPQPPVYQTAKWTCSCASVSHALSCIGIDVSEMEICRLLGLDKVNPINGLERGDGYDIAVLLQSYFGLPARNLPMTWVYANTQAGSKPFMLGGNKWYHWCSVIGFNNNGLMIANPSPGWMEVGNIITYQDWIRLGSWNAVLVDI